MDNLTHSLVGLTAAKAGLEKLSPAATTLCVLAANSPDSDVVVGFFADRWTLLHHHRGITHSIVGTITLAFVLPLIFYAGDRLLSRWRKRTPTVQFRGLLLASLIATATHPFLDWMNNYGVRPLLPWDSRWFYGDLLYIVDPFIWLLLGGGSFLLTSRTKLQRTLWIGLAAGLSWLVVFGPGRRGEVSHPNLLMGLWFSWLFVLVVLFVKSTGERLRSKVALTALMLVAVYWIGLSIAHRRAISIAAEHARSIATENQESVMRLAVMPTVANPFGWDCAFQTDGATYRFRFGIIDNGRSNLLVRYPKPTGQLAAAIEQVSQDRRLRIFLDFARFPVARLQDPACTTQTLVQFADLRYTEPGRRRASFTIDLPVNCQAFGTSR